MSLCGWSWDITYCHAAFAPTFLFLLSTPATLGHVGVDMAKLPTDKPQEILLLSQMTE
jgi:hypothetical protein